MLKPLFINKGKQEVANIRVSNKMRKIGCDVLYKIIQSLIKLTLSKSLYNFRKFILFDNYILLQHRFFFYKKSFHQ